MSWLAILVFALTQAASERPGVQRELVAKGAKCCMDDEGNLKPRSFGGGCEGGWHKRRFSLDFDTCESAKWKVLAGELRTAAAGWKWEPQEEAVLNWIFANLHRFHEAGIDDVLTQMHKVAIGQSTKGSPSKLPQAFVKTKTTTTQCCQDGNGNLQAAKYAYGPLGGGQYCDTTPDKKLWMIRFADNNDCDANRWRGVKLDTKGGLDEDRDIYFLMEWFATQYHKCDHVGDDVVITTMRGRIDAAHKDRDTALKGLRG